MALSVEIRPLDKSDYDRGFLQLLAQLTVAPNLPRPRFDDLVSALEAASAYQRTLVAVLVDGGSGAGVHPRPATVVGTASMILEQKFIRGGGVVGHLEDVVVDAKARGHGVGKRIVEGLLAWAKEKGCYKVILDCEESNIPFYERCGFKRKEVQMACYF